jgi:hypothetical protein
VRRGWKVSERENGKPVAWIAEAGSLTLSLRWRVISAAEGRQWWILFMLPAPHPFRGYAGGGDSQPARDTDIRSAVRPASGQRGAESGGEIRGGLAQAACGGVRGAGEFT